MNDSTWEAAEHLGYINKQGDILKCPECGSTHLTEQPTDIMGSIICEADICCVGCGSYVGYWAYGNYNTYDFVTYLVESGLVDWRKVNEPRGDNHGKV